MQKTHATSNPPTVSKTTLSTGWPSLDAHLDRLDTEAKAALWAALRVRHLEVMNKAEDRLNTQLDEVCNDPNCPAAVRFWLTLQEAAELAQHEA